MLRAVSRLPRVSSRLSGDASPLPGASSRLSGAFSRLPEACSRLLPPRRAAPFIQEALKSPATPSTSRRQRPRPTTTTATRRTTSSSTRRPSSSRRRRRSSRGPRSNSRRGPRSWCWPRGSRGPRCDWRRRASPSRSRSRPRPTAARGGHTRFTVRQGTGRLGSLRVEGRDVGAAAFTIEGGQGFIHWETGEASIETSIRLAAEGLGELRLLATGTAQVDFRSRTFTLQPGWQAVEPDKRPQTAEARRDDAAP